MGVLLIKDWLKIIENCYKNKLESEGFELTIDISWPEFYRFTLRDRMTPFNRTVAKTISKREIQQTDFDSIITEMVAELSEYREHDQKISLEKAMNRMNSSSIYGLDPLYRYSKTNGLPILNKIIFNGPATIVLWNDGTKTVVKCSDFDVDDPYAAVAQAYMKKIFGSNNQFKKMVDKWLPEEEDHRDFMDAMSYIAHCFKVPDSIVKKQEIISKENVEQIKETVEGDFNKRACVDCYYQSVPYDKEPCNACWRTGNHAKFVRREESKELKEDL